eukprot:CCRYP_003218-RB/>CCRYP_003218-RB protein AED:0.39 eAED:0.39 QI:0/0/0/1/0/0/2/0/169
MVGLPSRLFVSSFSLAITSSIIQFQHPHCCIHQRLRSPKSASSLCRPSSSIVTKNGKSNSEAMWDPTSQTYKDGIVPSHHAAMEIDDLLQVNQRKLRRFGCGWLSLSPCTEGSLSLADIEPDELDHYVTTTERTEKDNERRQVTGCLNKANGVRHDPVAPVGLSKDCVV